jgi:hypothetical protein
MEPQTMSNVKPAGDLKKVDLQNILQTCDRQIIIDVVFLLYGPAFR